MFQVDTVSYVHVKESFLCMEKDLYGGDSIKKGKCFLSVYSLFLDCKGLHKILIEYNSLKNGKKL